MLNNENAPVPNVHLASLVKTFVPHKRTLLITDQATDLDTLERSVFNLAIDLRRRYDLGED